MEKFAERDVLLVLGMYPTLYDGIIELISFEWLMPIDEGLPESKVEIKKVQPKTYKLKTLNLDLFVQNGWGGRIRIFGQLNQDRVQFSPCTGFYLSDPNKGDLYSI